MSKTGFGGYRKVRLRSLLDDDGRQTAVDESRRTSVEVELRRMISEETTATRTEDSRRAQQAADADAAVGSGFRVQG